MDATAEPCSRTELLWFGWFGFNAGSALGANISLPSRSSTPCWPAAPACSPDFAVERVRDGHATSFGAASGVVSGLVAITRPAVR